MSNVSWTPPLGGRIVSEPLFCVDKPEDFSHMQLVSGPEDSCAAKNSGKRSLLVMADYELQILWSSRCEKRICLGSLCVVFIAAHGL